MHGPLDSNHKRQLARERKRRRRGLEKRGMICLRVKVHEDGLATALPRSGRLTRKQALERAKLEEAVSLLVEDFIVRWGVTRPFE